MDIKECIIYNRTIPERTAKYAPYPEDLHPDMADFLRSQGITQVYTHQAEMFELARQDKNVVITTSTASGKTLSFLLPVIQRILEDPLSRAIFIYPTKALASDQYRALKPYLDFFGKDRLDAGVYDGDTPVNERSRIRKHANIILTNPEMLNAAFLPNHSQYGLDFVFANLKYVVVDEMHTYRGAFGSHVANVFRRLHRVCKFYHSDPRFLCSSATIANPVDLAENLTGEKFELVSKDGSPAPMKQYFLVQPPAVEGKDGQQVANVSVTTMTSELASQLTGEHRSFIAFARSRRSVEVILKETRDKLSAEGFFGSSYQEKVSGYRGGYTPLERKEIEQKMLNGSLYGLVSTNALELGIDIGKIESTVLSGYPGTRASFWQQTGRAGRSLKTSARNFLILDQTPMDQYIAIDPAWLFDKENEYAIIDKNNLFIELVHIRAAAAELPLTLDDIALFPDLGEVIPVLLSAKELNSANGKFAWNGEAFPAGDFSLRNIDKERFKLINQQNGKDITEMDEMQAYREIHPGAVYLHEGVAYEVTRLNLETKTGEAVPFNGNYYTVPGGMQETKILQTTESFLHGKTEVFFGDINVNEMVTMFKKLQFHNHQNLGYVQLTQPLSKAYDTEGCWISVPDKVVSTFRRALQRSNTGQWVRNNHYDGMCHALKHATMMLTMTEKEDIDVITSANAIGEPKEKDDHVEIYLYDKYVGGLGYSEKAFPKMPQIIENARMLVKNCRCKDGCPVCVGDYKLDKNLVAWGLESLLTESEPPRDLKIMQEAEQPVLEKQFNLETLPNHWKEFCEYCEKTGDSYTAFFKTIERVSVEGNVLTFYLNNAFYQSWVLEPANKKSIIGILQFHVEGCASVELKTALTEEANSKENWKKIEKRFDDLKRQN